MKTRREFLNATFSGCSGFGVAAALSTLGSRLVRGETNAEKKPLVATRDEKTGLPLLRLPEGFRYISYGWTDDPMCDGIPTPPEHDGMGVVKADGDILTIMRNHELGADGKAWPIKGGRAYDCNAQGGCTMLKFDSARGEYPHAELSGNDA